MNNSGELFCSCLPGRNNSLSFGVQRYMELQVYKVLTDAAASLVEVLREAAPVFEVVAAFGSASVACRRQATPRS